MVKKQKLVKCCGFSKKWAFDITMPQDAKPLQKLLFAYLIPFLNEKYMNIWNTGDSHEIEDIKHDRQWAEMQKGTSQVLFDRLVDQMSYKNISATELPALIGKVTLTNPSRQEGQAVRYGSYKASPALMREYVRRKKIEAKSIMLQQILEAEMKALEEHKEAAKQ